MALAITKNAPTASSIAAIEATAVDDAFNHPWRALGVALRGIRIEGKNGARYSVRQAAARRLPLQPARRAKLAEITKAEAPGKHLSAAE